MSANPHTGELPAIGAPAARQSAAERAGLRARHAGEALFARVGPQHAALVAILALSLVLDTHRLSQNGYANTFYSAGVLSMLRSLHNFLFASFDPGGLITIDKPPLGVWVQVASAKLFGFSPLSLLLPEAIGATIAVAALYGIVARRLGAAAGLGSALALAVFPSFVAVSRDNGVDTVLILLMALACGAALRAIEGGRWRWLIGSAALVGLAFNTKTLAAYLVIPGIALGYLVCAPGPLWRRAMQLLAAGVVAGAVSFAWIAFVELTPAGSRPFVGSSTDNTELGLTFSYNGFGRVQGEVGGPGRIPVAPGAVVAPPVRHLPSLHGAVVAAPVRHLSGLHGATVLPRPRRRLSAVMPNGRNRHPIAFAGPVGALRLFRTGLGDQGAWLLPFAFVGLLALVSAVARRGASRRDPRLAVAFVLGGWLVCEAAVLSFSKGIVHPYYVSALAPGAAAMVGAGAVAFVDFARQRDWRVTLAPLAVAWTVMVQLVLLHQQRYMQWFPPVLIGLAALGVALMSIRRAAGGAMAIVVGALAIAPGAFAATTWLAPVEGTFPAAGPHEATGVGLYGQSPRGMRVYRALVRYVSVHHPGTRWAVLVDASPTAAPLILLGLDAGAVGGYSGTDPALDGPTLAHMVARREARYVVLGGAYSSRGGNLATRAVLRDCSQVPAGAWHGPRPSRYALVLFDCARHEHALAAAPRH